MKLLRLLLFPLMPLYYFATWVRNKWFDLGLLRSTSYEVPIVCVGNLSTGGTGKTPMVEYLIRLLNTEYRVAVLSRGYGRKTKGFVLASESKTHLEIGDEPLQYHSKYTNITVAVDEKRAHGIDNLLQMDVPPEVVILDDAFQHRYVSAQLTILLTSYQQPFYNDLILPTGNLREPRLGYKRADVIVVTKCPDTLSDKEKRSIISKIKPLKNQTVFFSKIKYSNQVVDGKGNIHSLESLNPFTLVTGIANPNPLVAYLNHKNLKFDHIRFADHYNFRPKDFETLAAKGTILTTEKDFVRLRDSSLLRTNKVYYLPIEFALDDHETFNSRLKQVGV